MVTMETLKKLVGEFHKDYSSIIKIEEDTNECEVEMLKEQMHCLEYQNMVNVERLQEYMINKESGKQKDNAEIEVCRKIIDHLKNKMKEKDLLYDKETVLHYQNENEELKKELKIRKNVRFEDDTE